MTSTSRLLYTLLMAGCLAGCPIDDTSNLQGTKRTEGRAPGTNGSAAARNYIVDVIRPFTEGALGGSGNQSYFQTYGSGTNVLAVVPGSDLANEVVIVGAHYDHLGNNCTSSISSDFICNGATDNATGVSVVMQIARAMSEDGFRNRRTLLLGFWDEEETGLRGSRYFLENPISADFNVVGYVNFDIQGINTLPSQIGSSFVLGSESGGSVMTNAVNAAIAASPVDYRRLSAPFGNNLSDQTNFLAAGIPSVFFTDGKSPCYHTAQDDIRIVDGKKLDRQAAVGSSLVRSLLNGGGQPSFQSPAIRFQDAAVLVDFAESLASDQNRFGSNLGLFQQARSTANAIASKGAGAFTAADAAALGQAALDLTRVVRNAGACAPIIGN